MNVFSSSIFSMGQTLDFPAFYNLGREPARGGLYKCMIFRVQDGIREKAVLIAEPAESAEPC